MSKRFYFIEHTDLFAGEANYSWVRRYIVTANTERGAMRRIAKGWRNDYAGRYNSVSGCTCWFVDQVDETEAERLTARYSQIERV